MSTLQIKDECLLYDNLNVVCEKAHKGITVNWYRISRAPINAWHEIGLALKALQVVPFAIHVEDTNIELTSKYVISFGTESKEQSLSCLRSFRRLVSEQDLSKFPYNGKWFLDYDKALNTFSKTFGTDNIGSALAERSKRKNRKAEAKAKKGQSKDKMKKSAEENKTDHKDSSQNLRRKKGKGKGKGKKSKNKDSTPDYRRERVRGYYHGHQGRYMDPHAPHPRDDGWYGH